MDESKPFWQSKTLWANVLTAVVALANQSLDWIEISAEQTAAFLVVANVVLRLVTKGSVSLT